MELGLQRYSVVAQPRYEGTNISLGMTGDAGDRGTLAEVDITGQIHIETPGGPVGDINTLAFRISQRNKNRWNALLAFNREMNKVWSVIAEAGFGCCRQNLIAGVTYRC